MTAFIAQSVGLLAMAANILAFQFKSRRNIILCQLMGSVFFAINMFMLDALMGGILNIVGIARALVYLKKDQIKIPIRWVTALFLIAYSASYVLVFTVFAKEATPQNLIVEVLPIIGMSAMTIGLSGTNAKRIRICGFVNSPCWLTYNSINFSIGGILCEVFSIISVILAYLRLDTKRTTKAEGEHLS